MLPLFYGFTNRSRFDEQAASHTAKLADAEAFCQLDPALDVGLGDDEADKNRNSSGVYVQRVDTRFYSD
jgi:hypothetical protein